MGKVRLLQKYSAYTHIHPHITGTPESIMGGPDHPQAVASQGFLSHLLLAFPAFFAASFPSIPTVLHLLLSGGVFYPRVEDKTAN